MAKKTGKKRRIRSPHPGVVIVAPWGEHKSYRLRYRCPERGKWHAERIDGERYSGEKSRRDLAIKRSEELRTRRAAILGGAPLAAANVPVRTLIERFVADCQAKRLSEHTVKKYRSQLQPFVKWCEDQRFAADDLTSSTLAAYAVVAGKTAVMKRVKSVDEEKRYRESQRPRKSRTLNNYLQAASIALTRLAGLKLLPKLNKFDIAEALKLARIKREPLNPLSTAQLNEILEGALGADSEAAQFFLFLLLSGCRHAEGLELDWSNVRLGALDDQGRVCGEMVVKGKTGYRVVSFDVSPALLRLMQARKLRTGGQGRVWPWVDQRQITRINDAIVAAGAPDFTPQELRRACASYQSCAPGIYGAAAPLMSARRLGHSARIAEERYVGTIRGISRDCTTVEAAMGIEAVAAEITRRACGASLAVASPSRASQPRGARPSRAPASPALAVGQ